jgi:hypothetical protein
MVEPAGIWPALAMGPLGAKDATGLPQSGAAVVAVGAVVVVEATPEADPDPWVELQPATMATANAAIIATVPMRRRPTLIGIPSGGW